MHDDRSPTQSANRITKKRCVRPDWESMSLREELAYRNRRCEELGVGASPKPDSSSPTQRILTDSQIAQLIGDQQEIEERLRAQCPWEFPDWDGRSGVGGAIVVRSRQAIVSTAARRAISRGSHGHAPGTATPRHQGSRRTSSSSSSSGTDPGDPDGDPDPPGVETPPAGRETAEKTCRAARCDKSIASMATQAVFCSDACRRHHARAENKRLGIQSKSERAARDARESRRILDLGSLDKLQREMETDGDGQYLGPNSQRRILGSPAQLRERRELGERRARERAERKAQAPGQARPGEGKPSGDSPEGQGDTRDKVATVVELAVVRPLRPAFGFARADTRELVAA